MATFVFNEPEFTLYPPTPSTNICNLVTGLESVVPADICTGELTVSLLVGSQMVTVRLIVLNQKRSTLNVQRSSQIRCSLVLVLINDNRSENLSTFD